MTRVLCYGGLLVMLGAAALLVNCIPGTHAHTDRVIGVGVVGAVAFMVGLWRFPARPRWQEQWHSTGATRERRVLGANGITYVYQQFEQVSDTVEGRSRWRDSGTYTVLGPGDRVHRYTDSGW